jgi:D-alanyl-D-alanine carboxypeptidase
MLTPLSLILKTRVIMKKNNRRKPYRYFFVLIFTLHCLLSSVSFADEIHSRSVVVMDPSTEEIVYAKNPYLKRPPASTTKLMTAIVVVENANLSDVVTISRKASRVSPHKAGFREGDRVTVEQLLYAARLILPTMPQWRSLVAAPALRRCSPRSMNRGAMALAR